MKSAWPMTRAPLGPIKRNSKRASSSSIPKVTLDWFCEGRQELVLPSLGSSNVASRQKVYRAGPTYLLGRSVGYVGKNDKHNPGRQRVPKRLQEEGREDLEGSIAGWPREAKQANLDQWPTNELEALGMREHPQSREVDMDKMPTPITPIVVNGNSTFPSALESPEGDAMSLVQSPVSYPQDWVAYNEAQTNEKLLFLQLLGDLTAQVPTQERSRAGRPSANLGEMIFACCMKIYLNFSSRRTESDLKMAEQLEYLGHTPHFNTILKYLNKPGLTPILKQLIEFSAMPVKQLEEHFAADSSGFSTSMFGRWCDVRVKRHERRLFRKAHVMVGVKTNVIASIEVTGGFVSDYEPFPALLERLCKNMSVKEISADMGYSSRKVLGLVSEHGAIPFIPFKKHANNRAERCAIWKAMYRYFHEHREDFMSHYHKRSNVESVFSMMKRKQGTHLKSRNMIGQTNEILCKALVHNICVLIQEIFESGITVDFQLLAEDELMCKTLP